MSEIELYRFVMGERIWTMTSSDLRQTYNAGSGVEVYVPVAMGRSEVENKNSLARANLDIRIPLDHELSVFAMTSLYDEGVSLTLFEKDGADVSVQWKGRLVSKKPDEVHCTLVFESVFTSLRRSGLRARMQKSCRHALYFRGCNLNMEDFEIASTLTSIDGSICVVPAAAGQPDGYFLGGVLAAADGTLAYIVNHSGDELTLQRVPYSLRQQFQLEGAGSAVSIYPGCDHTRPTCNSKFANGLNYGGFDWIPSKNPMGGSSIV